MCSLHHQQTRQEESHAYYLDWRIKIFSVDDLPTCSFLPAWLPSCIVSLSTEDNLKVRCIYVKNLPAVEVESIFALFASLSSSVLTSPSKLYLIIIILIDYNSKMLLRNNKLQEKVRKSSNFLKQLFSKFTDQCIL